MVCSRPHSFAGVAGASRRGLGARRESPELGGRSLVPFWGCYAPLRGVCVYDVYYVFWSGVSLYMVYFLCVWCV